MRWFSLAALAAVKSFLLLTVFPYRAPVTAISEGVLDKGFGNYDIRTDKSE